MKSSDEITKRIKENVAFTLNNLMYKLMMTQKDCSELLGIPQGRLSKYLNKREMPRIDTLQKIAKHAGVTIDSLCN